MPEEFAAASVSHLFPKRHKHVRESIEIMQGIWTNDLFEYHGEFADFDRCGFGAKPLQKGTDSPDYATYFSGTFFHDNGTPFIRPQLACLFERTLGDPAWRHGEEDN